MFKNKKYDFKNFSVSIVIAVLLLCSIGVYCLYKAGDISMAKRQLIGIALGLFVIFVGVMIDYHFICKFVILYYFIAIMLLVMVRFTSYGVDHDTGAFRWLRISSMEVQPSELVKIILILVLSVLFTKVQSKLNRWGIFLLSGIVMMIPTSLILIQTDLSSSMVCMFIFAMMIFMAGLSLKIIGITLAVSVPIGAGLFWYVIQPGQKLLTNEQQKRILSFLDPEKYALTVQYQQIHSVNAIASGKVLGKTLLGDVSDFRLYNKVYVNESDFIFSVVAEELGFIGCVLVISLFAFIVFKCILIAKKTNDFTGKMIAIGVSAMLVFQSFVNISVNTALLPNTGLPLPFMSYGLSSLLSNFLGIALVLNVGVQKAKHSLFSNVGENEIFL
ncbi:MAG: FtsW/RodA/SpoVE family cell cycle protein [Catonella sp.]|uniref:FtsW/RodA/SpoVE family cell cycle protein n=1 Tax=Catonella sp. TaxID=2382125 RepID=UPI003FA1258B